MKPHIKMKSQDRIPWILTWCLSCNLASVSGLEDHSHTNTKSLKSYTQSRLTFSYDGTESDWSAARYAEGAAAVPAQGALVLPAVVSSCERQESLQSPASIILLVRRGDCSFQEKVLNVKHLSNLTGVIIYNDRQEKDLTNIYVNKTNLPVIFTSLNIGKNLTDILRRGEKVNVTVSVESVCQQRPESSHFHCVRSDQVPVSEWDIVWMAVTIFILAALSLTSATCYYLRRLNSAEHLEQLERKAELLAKRALSEMEVTTVSSVEAGSQQCSVCLEVLIEGQEMRRLPCRHSYHRACVDTWLTQKRKCPLCKLDIIQHFRGTWSD